MTHVYCPECGFQNPEAANYCAKCGALLVRDSGAETTMAYTLDEGEEVAAEVLEDLGVKGPPPERTTSAGPLTPRSSRISAASSSRSSSV